MSENGSGINLDVTGGTGINWDITGQGTTGQGTNVVELDEECLPSPKEQAQLEAIKQKLKGWTGAVQSVVGAVQQIIETLADISKAIGEFSLEKEIDQAVEKVLGEIRELVEKEVAQTKDFVVEKARKDALDKLYQKKAEQAEDQIDQIVEAINKTKAVYERVMRCANTVYNPGDLGLPDFSEYHVDLSLDGVNDPLVEPSGSASNIDNLMGGA